MKLPIQAQPVNRGANTVKAKIGDGISPSVDWLCVIECGAAVAKCALSSDPVQCLVSAGLGKCVKCL